MCQGYRTFTAWAGNGADQGVVRAGGIFSLALSGSGCLGGAEGQRKEKSQIGVCSPAGSEVARGCGKNPAHGMHTWDVVDLGTARPERDHWWEQAGIQHCDLGCPSCIRKFGCFSVL